jgi:hypothetical protein
MTTEFEKAVESALGEPIESVRSVTIGDRRAMREQKTGKPSRFESYFPLIGRGNVLRDRAVDHETVESELRGVLRGEK